MVESYEEAAEARTPVDQRRLLTAPAAPVPNHAWFYDLMATMTHGGTPLRMLTVNDEYTRYFLTIMIARRFNSNDEVDARPLNPRPHPSRQLAGVHGRKGPRVARSPRRRHTVYRAGLPMGERVQREPPRQAT
jgi:hypothetical protein